MANNRIDLDNWTPVDTTNPLKSLAHEVGEQLDALDSKFSKGVTSLGFASGYVNAGTFVTLDNIKATIATSGSRGISVASVSGSFTASIAGHYMYSYASAEGTATAYPGHTTTVTPSGSWFNWSFGNAGDTSIFYVNDYNNKRFYRITVMIGASYLNNFISIERLC